MKKSTKGRVNMSGAAGTAGTAGMAGMTGVTGTVGKSETSPNKKINITPTTIFNSSVKQGTDKTSSYKNNPIQNKGSKSVSDTFTLLKNVFLV
ncbi:MAG: hypothetical protein GY861_27985 [bacterium]|nr:hypothetical protein [bacterium]